MILKKRYVDATGTGIANAELLQGTPLSYNNILDGDAAYRCIRGIYFVPLTIPQAAALPFMCHADYDIWPRAVVLSWS